MNVVHIDEKWFFLTCVKNTYYLLPDNEPAPRAVQSKRHIVIDTFLAAGAGPREGFGPKIRILPFVEKINGLKNSKSRPAGNFVTTLVNVTKELYRETMTKKVLPTIKEKYPWPSLCSDECSRILLQQENAKPHIRPYNAIFREDVETMKPKFDVELLKQPPSSPDLNFIGSGLLQVHRLHPRQLAGGH